MIIFLFFLFINFLKIGNFIPISSLFHSIMFLVLVKILDTTALSPVDISITFMLL